MFKFANDLTKSEVNALVSKIATDLTKFIDFYQDAYTAVSLMEQYRVSVVTGRRGDEDGYTAWAKDLEDLEVEGENLLDAGLRAVIVAHFESTRVDLRLANVVN